MVLLYRMLLLFGEVVGASSSLGGTAADVVSELAAAATGAEPLGSNETVT